MSPVVVNILDLIDMGGSEVIEHKLATFSSPKNPEIFLIPPPPDPRTYPDTACG